MMASMNGHLQVVQYLIEKGADVNMVNKVSQLNLHILFCFFKKII